MNLNDRCPFSLGQDQLGVSFVSRVLGTKPESTRRKTKNMPTDSFLKLLEMFARLLESQCFQLPWLIQELCRRLRVRVAKRTSLARTKHWARSMRTAKQEFILTRAIPGSFCLLPCHSLVPNRMVLQDALTSKLETLKVVLLHMQDYIL